jgi:methionyl-tRNA formyltransferase
MKRNFDLICFFGYSPFFPRLADLCQSLGFEYAFVFAPRQRDSIDSLTLPDHAQKICATSLKDNAYKDLKAANKHSLGVSFGSPYIFSAEDIATFQGGLLNSHGAPLPDFKGGGGFSWRILQRDKRGASLMHFVTEEIDEGPCVFRKDFVFSDSERIPLDHEIRQLKEDEDNLIPWLESVIAGENSLTPLGSEADSFNLGTYFPRLSSDFHGYIDWRMPVNDLKSFILAFSKPYSGASTFIKGKKTRIFDCFIREKCFMHPLTRGLVLSRSEDHITVACESGIIEIELGNLKFENEPCKIAKGDRFYTPESHLQEALNSRTFFNSEGVQIKLY